LIVSRANARRAAERRLAAFTSPHYQTNIPMPTPESNSSPQNRKAVGIYDRPASADRPRTRTLALAAIVVALIVAVIFFVRAH